MFTSTTSLSDISHWKPATNLMQSSPGSKAKHFRELSLYHFAISMPLKTLQFLGPRHSFAKSWTIYFALVFVFCSSLMLRCTVLFAGFWRRQSGWTVEYCGGSSGACRACWFSVRGSVALRQDWSLSQRQNFSPLQRRQSIYLKPCTCSRHHWREAFKRQKPESQRNNTASGETRQPKRGRGLRGNKYLLLFSLPDLSDPEKQILHPQSWKKERGGGGCFFC